MSNTAIYIDPGSEKFITESKDLESAYGEACEWISSLGIDYKKTRFGAYEKDLVEFIKNGGKGTAEEKVRTFFNAHLEANELIRIKSSFDSLGSDQDLDTIRKSVSGQRFRNASKKDQSRDFAFELGMASRFLKAGYKVDLRSITDLVVEIHGRRLYVECKRLKSDKQLEKRVKEANEQIKRRLNQDKSSKARGMIALNLTDVINPDAIPIITKSIDEYRADSAETLKSFVLSNKSTLSKKKSSKCLGVFSEFSTQGFIYTEKPEDCAFANIREGNIYQYPLKAEEREFLNSFWEYLGNQDLM